MHAFEIIYVQRANTFIAEGGGGGRGLPSPISAIVAIVIKLALTKCTERYTEIHTHTGGERGRNDKKKRAYAT